MLVFLHTVPGCGWVGAGGWMGECGGWGGGWVVHYNNGIQAEGPLSERNMDSLMKRLLLGMLDLFYENFGSCLLRIFTNILRHFLLVHVFLHCLCTTLFVCNNRFALIKSQSLRVIK